MWLVSCFMCNYNRLPSLVRIQSLSKWSRARYANFSSNSVEQNNDGEVNADKLTEFFKKTEETIAQTQEAEQMIAQPEDTTESQTSANDRKTMTSRSKDKDGPKAVHFVPWTMSRFLQGMNIRKLPAKRTEQTEKSFATLLRHSPFVQLGDFKSREVIGVVIENINNTDLYIDFGGKFHCVCPQPANQSYPRGSLVRIRLRDPEMANKFMINTKAISLCEADAILIGPYRGRVQRSGTEDPTIPTVAGDPLSPSRCATDADNVSVENWKLL